MCTHTHIRSVCAPTEIQGYLKTSTNALYERQVNLGIFFSVLKGLQIYFSSGAISPDGSVVFFPSIIMTGIADNV